MSFGVISGGTPSSSSLGQVSVRNDTRVLVGEPGGFSRGRGGGGGMFSGSGVGRGNRGGSRGSGVFRGSRGGGRRGVANGGGRGRERINKTSEELNQELESFFNDPHNETE
eukprot:c9029_g1_i2.p1 GENE.c9029_g1_i2~~c9029_g1_i2.p1  ORF type:complete len:111 (-),score=17.62 c9029_g1_i2:88-420(-)